MVGGVTPDSEPQRPDILNDISDQLAVQSVRRLFVRSWDSHAFSLANPLELQRRQKWADLTWVVVGRVLI